MRVIAATFKDHRSANRALMVLRAAFDLDQEQAQLAPLGVAGSESSDSTVLAGHFRDASVDTVRELFERYGGLVVTDVDENLTRRRTGLPVVPEKRVPVIAEHVAANGRHRKAHSGTNHNRVFFR